MRVRNKGADKDQDEDGGETHFANEVFPPDQTWRLSIFLIFHHHIKIKGESQTA